MRSTLDVRAVGGGAPRGIRIPATALKGRRPRPLDDGGSQLHREHRIVPATYSRTTVTNHDGYAPPVRRPSPRSGRGMRRLVPVLTVAFVVPVLVGCGGDGGGSTKAFCDSVRELRKLGREPGSTESADPQQLEATIAGLRDLERSAPSDLKGDIATIRDTLETIASVG